jgi:hypothetical protein
MGLAPEKASRIRLERNWVAPTQTLVLIPGPLDLRSLASQRSSNFVKGPGISQRAAAARTQGPWRGWSSWDGPRIVRGP